MVSAPVSCLSATVSCLSATVSCLSAAVCQQLSAANALIIWSVMSVMQVYVLVGVLAYVVDRTLRLYRYNTNHPMLHIDSPVGLHCVAQLHVLFVQLHAGFVT